MSEIVRDLGELRRLISTGKITLSEVMEKLAPKAEVAVVAEPQPPKQIVLSDKDRTLLRTLPSKLADVQLPAEPRELTAAERAQYVPLFDQVKTAKAAVTKAEEALKEAMHGHIDATTDGPVGKNGHKLTEGEVVAPEYAQKAVRGLVGGNAVELTVTDLEELLDAGKITLAQFKRWTHKVTTTQVVPNAVMADLAKSGELLDVIASKARRTEQTTAIRMAKN